MFFYFHFNVYLFILIFILDFGWKRCVIRSAIVLLGVVVGESVPRFDIVMSLIGGTLTGPLLFVLPPIMYAKAKALKQQAKKQQIAVQSAAECRSSDENIIDPRAHSQSVHYGFRDNGTKNRKCIYYSNDEENTTSGDDQHCEDKSEKTKGENIALVDATVPEKSLKRKLDRPIVLTEEQTSKIISNKIVHWFGYFVVIIGILITVSSTYINIKNTIRFVKFTPPCIVNATMAAHF